ncbi:aldo/keto reductase [Motilimonas pumila]|uniref:Aldo/keto reductase n=1 Tax=Motilimonas pumila TaxID=2303987 RepID=A0A418YGM6_9GAMM|nr:aldo/keto reductase [Motilimonas pumila]RJG49018.1 aldo/keto reductase [Motilimonas pumila]
MKLALGCVQFGLNYGVTNTAGKVSEAEASNILHHAHLAGVDTLDTAALYGASETVLGQNDSGHHFQIVTKLPAINSVNELERAVSASLSKLKVKRLQGLLFHRTDILFTPVGRPLSQRLQQYQKDGVIAEWGASVYHPKELLNLLANYSIGLVQLPLNILDQRFLSPEITQALQANQVTVHARSLLLQGLLCQATWPKAFNQWRHIQQQLADLTMHHQVSPMTLAMSICHQATNVERFVLGFQSVEQLKQGIQAYHLGAKLQLQLATLAQKDEQLINPARWSALKKTL